MTHKFGSRDRERVRCGILLHCEISLSQPGDGLRKRSLLGKPESHEIRCFAAQCAQPVSCDAQLDSQFSASISWL